jgi:hypothetical protein
MAYSTAFIETKKFKIILNIQQFIHQQKNQSQSF